MSIAYTGDAATTRTNLGLGDAATKTTGTSPGNVPVLDGTGKLSSAVVGATALTTVQTAVSESAQLALTAVEGDVVVRSDENKTYMKNAGTAGTMSDFTLLATPTDAVTSVNGGTGVVTVDTDLVNDTTPQLGGSLDVNGNNITGIVTSKGANYTAVNGDSLIITAGSITITLPATPSAGDTVTVKDGTGAAATTNWTVARNGSNIASSATDLTFDKNWAEITMTYIGATVGWSV